MWAIMLTAAPFRDTAQAQNRIAAFGTIGVSLAVVANANRTGFHDLWRPAIGAELALAAPFYAGRVELGAERMKFAGRGDVPDYRAWFLFAGWGPDIGLGPLRWEPGVRVGTYAMAFTGPGVPDDRRSESELGVEAVSHLAWAPLPAWQLVLTGRYRAVFTHPEIRHAFAAIGVRRTFLTPRWLRDFLD